MKFDRTIINHNTYNTRGGKVHGGGEEHGDGGSGVGAPMSDRRRDDNNNIMYKAEAIYASLF